MRTCGLGSVPHQNASLHAPTFTQRFAFHGRKALRLRVAGSGVQGSPCTSKPQARASKSDVTVRIESRCFRCVRVVTALVHVADFRVWSLVVLRPRSCKRAADSQPTAEPLTSCAPHPTACTPKQAGRKLPVKCASHNEKTRRMLEAPQLVAWVSCLQAGIALHVTHFVGLLLCCLLQHIRALLVSIG